MQVFMRVLLVAILAIVSQTLPAQTNAGIQVQVDATTGVYTVRSGVLNWTWSGSIGQPLKNLRKSTGRDSIGAYTAVSFQYQSNNRYTAGIRWYASSPVVIFSLTTPDGATDQSMDAFPDFTSMPGALHAFSFHNRIFPLAQFFLEETSSPWLFFNDNKDACILSPASDFIVSLMSGDGETHVRSGLNTEVKKLPAHFTHSSILVMSHGIQHTWNTWGESLRAMYHRKRPANDADALLKYYGYWTDVGGDYYYKYDSARGYAGTLLALREHYKKEGIPLGYMQLDSWWYQKSTNNVYGKKGAAKKMPEFPEAPWNRSGGLMEYTADPAIFPEGLATFQKKLGLPLVTHNRWIDSASPYHQRFKISGIGATDPAYWKEIMSYLKSANVAVYEQDWINYIYTLNPEMISDVSVGNAFTDGMAKAALDQGINIQYCMGLPRYFMQGVKYNNLTTIRTAGDRFMPKRWMYFLFTSQLAYEMGIWPWSDVFKSSELNNMIVSVLSAGPVGTGDSIGTENKQHIFMACRADGVLVKPDMPLLPLDQNYVQMAKRERKPVVAATYTLHGKIKTAYVFAFADDSTRVNQYSFNLHDVGIKGKSVLFDPLQKSVRLMNDGETFTADLPGEKFSFFIAAPITKSGIAFLGDAGKIAATGKKRITSITEVNNKLRVNVLFAKGEQAVTLQGYAERSVLASIGKLQQDAGTHLFTLEVLRPVTGDQVIVEFQTRQTHTVWLDDLPIQSYSESIRPVNTKFNYGKDTLRIKGVPYSRGLGLQSVSVLPFLLNKQATRFAALVGMDDDANKGIPVTFYVIGDRKILFQSAEMNIGDGPVSVDVDLTGIRQLGLLVTDRVGGIRNKRTYANWVDARLEMTGTAMPGIVRDNSVKYILTPAAGKKPRINSAKVFGATPGNPFLYTVAATGQRPMRFSATDLPTGLSILKETGIISGSVAERGVYTVTLHVRNALGAVSQKLIIKIGDTIALTPPLGWNGWNSWAESIDAKKVIASANAVVEKGLSDHGWTYINIDDSWQGVRSGPNNSLQPNSKFPRFKDMVDHIHSLGLKAGLYSTPYISSYAGYVGNSSEFPQGGETHDSIKVNRQPFMHIGKYRFETNDAEQMAEWGVDFLKYDWRIDVGSTERMSKALKNSGRDVVFSLSNNAPFEKANDWMRLSNMYRTGPDIKDSWTSLYTNVFSLDKWASFTGPGHWSDPDMMIVGKVSIGPALHDTRLTTDEQYAHVSIFSLLAAPMLIGCPIEQLDEFTLNLLTNDEVIAINQDPLGKAGRLLLDEEGVQVWVKPLEDGSYGVGLFNIDGYEKTPASYFRWGDEQARQFTFDFTRIGLKGEYRLRDVWRQKDLGTFTGIFHTSIPHHGVVMLRMFPVQKTLNQEQ